MASVPTGVLVPSIRRRCELFAENRFMMLVYQSISSDRRFYWQARLAIGLDFADVSSVLAVVRRVFRRPNFSLLLSPSI
jgi:hypothetical protein